LSSQYHIFYRTVSFWQLSHVFSHFWSIFYCVCADMATYLLSVENLTPDLSSPCPIFCRTWNFGDYTMFRAIFAQSFTVHAPKQPFFYFGQIFSWKFEILISDSYSMLKFGGTCGKICACLGRKTGFVVWIWGARGREYPFLVETSKRHFLAQKHAFWAIGCLGLSSGFTARW